MPTQSETLQFQHSERVKPGVIEFLHAENFLRQGLVTVGGKVLKNISNTQDANPIIQKISNRRLNEVISGHRPHRFSLSFSPIEPYRKYKSEYIDLPLNGSLVPFKVSRKQQKHTIIDLDYTYTSLLWPKDIFFWGDEFIVSNNLAFDKNNSVDMSVNTQLIHYHSQGKWKNGTYFEIGQRSTEGQRTFKIGSDTEINSFYGLSKIRIGYSVYNKPILPYKNLSHISFEQSKKVNKILISSQMVTYLHSSKEYDFNSFYIRGSLPVDKIDSELSLQISKRLDKNINFPFDFVRNDNSLEVALNKKMKFRNLLSEITIGLEFNKSNIDAYSFDEFQFGIIFPLVF